MSNVIKAFMPNPITPENSNIRKCCPEDRNTMSRDKQIEEMAVELGVYACKKTPCRNCAVDHGCIWRENATVLYNAGYRKSTDVAEEIFAEIEHTARAAIILLKFEKDEKLRNTKTECYTDLIGYIAELKKKYTENKGE